MAMFEIREKPQKVERALLVRIYFDRREEEEAEKLLLELKELVTTLGIGVEDILLVNARKMQAKFLCGTGKAAEVVEFAEAHECDCIVFDNMLAPHQQRSWEELAGVTVIDREEVILDIFADRAQTREATLQVELARMQYALPRMARMWAHLDRQGGSGGGATSRGEGEKQIEVDRRLARAKIDSVKRELELVRKQRATQRKTRETTEIAHAAIVGYTNAGKSTLLNQLTGDAILAKDMLFATLDTTTRKIDLPDGQPLLITDTVGFIRNLPHRLVEAFKSTLEEAVLADFLIQVLDVTDPEAMQYYQTTCEVLQELGAEDKEMIVALNKCDALEDELELKAFESQFEKSVRISAKAGIGMDDLLNLCTLELVDKVKILEYKIPQFRGDLVSLLHSHAKVDSTEYEGNDVLIKAIVPAAIEGKVREFQLNAEPVKKEAWEK